MPSDSKFTRDNDGNVAVRVVSNTGVSEQPDSMFTTDEDGNVAVRVVFGEGGGGGGDSHNKGFYATPTALNEAVPTAEAGDYAIVGSTDTVWIWDTDTSAWVDSDQKGQVTSVNNRTGAVTVSEVPSQTGNAGKFLTTDGTDASWSDKPLVNTATQPESGALGISATVTGYEALGIKTLKGQGTRSITIGAGSETQAGSESEMAIGRTSQAAGSYACAIGNQAKAYGANCHAIGYNAVAGDYRYYSTYGAWQFGSGTNSEAGTVCFALTTSNDYQHWTNYKLLDSDGTIPADRLKNAINKYSTMPTASSTNEGWIVQFTGTTDSTYTHGHLYECVSDGQNPATYSWTEVSMGGGSSYTAGTGIDITNNTISVASPVARLELASGSTVGSVYGMWAKTTTITPYRCLVLGHNASMNSTSASGAVVLGAEAVGGNGTVSVGGGSSATVADGIAIGNAAKSTSSGAVQIGYGTNSTSNTFQWKSYRLVSSDGTIPTARLTKVNTTITLTAAGWSSNTQTVNVTGMTANGVVFVSPDPTDQSAYTSSGIICSAQAANSLTFTCSTTPSADLSVNVVML